MRRTYPLLAIIVAAVVISGCGGDDADELDTPRLSSAEIYRSNVEAQCVDAKERVKALSFPDIDDSAALAVYLKKVVDIEENLQQTLQRLKPPAEIATGYAEALAQEKRLGNIVAGYYRAARGGRGFDVVLGQLEREANPQIRRVNRAFGAIEMRGCEGDELELGFADQ